MDDYVLCPSCLRQNKPTAGYCRYCGTALADAVPDANSAPWSEFPLRRRRRPAVLALSGVVLLVFLGLAGWLAKWPPAVFPSATRPVAATAPERAAAAPSQVTAPTPSPLPSTAPAAGTPLASASTDSPPASGPAETVQQYYAAINAEDYHAAWDLGGRNTGGSYSQFAAGFADTAEDVFSVESVSGNVVTGSLDAQQADGTSKTYSGTYTVSGNVITQFDVQQVS